MSLAILVDMNRSPELPPRWSQLTKPDAASGCCPYSPPTSADEPR